jgi:hypothetical protein
MQFLGAWRAKIWTFALILVRFAPDFAQSRLERVEFWAFIKYRSGAKKFAPIEVLKNIF